MQIVVVVMRTLFLSTLSLRRATYLVRGQRPSWGISIHALLAESDGIRHINETGRKNFYPRSPCGERQQAQRLKVPAHGISIHALLAESDAVMDNIVLVPGKFLSTLSLRRATAHYDNYNLHCVISIHALLAESDFACFGRLEVIHYFYPRSPCGERPLTDDVSTGGKIISIHALLAESDSKSAQNSGVLLRI